MGTAYKKAGLSCLGGDQVMQHAKGSGPPRKGQKKSIYFKYGPLMPHKHRFFSRKRER